MRHLLDMTTAELTAELAGLDVPAYRAGQIRQWIWAKGVTRLADMTNLPAALRDSLSHRLTVLRGQIVDRRQARDGVVKLLIEWPDGERTETVAIPADGRRSACLSTQVGCPIGCAFCASGLDGVSRDLSAGEIVEQVLHLQSATGQRITHVVFMGTGEPLANYQATVAAVRTLIDPQRGALSARHITVSTIGLPQAMRRLADEGIPVTLAISLHAANDRLRRRLIPWAKSVDIADLIAAGQEYFRRSGRELTLEYVLLAGTNDSHRCADELIDLARQLRCNVNLIRYNDVDGLGFSRCDETQVLAFRDRLSAAGVNVQIRASRGGQVQAACGQLRRAHGPPTQ